MAISFINSWSAQSSGNVTSGLGIDTSTGTQGGNLLIAFIMTVGTGTISPPDGTWSTIVPQWQSGGGFSYFAVVFAKPAASGAVYTFTTGGNSVLISGGIIALDGANSTFDTAGTGDNGNGTQISASSISPSSNPGNDYLLWFAGVGGAGGNFTATTPSGYTQAWANQATATTNGTTGAYKGPVGGGATGAVTDGTAPSIWLAVNAAVAPLVGDTPSVRLPMAAITGNQTTWAAPQMLRQHNVVFRAANLPDPYRVSHAPLPARQAGMAQWWAPVPALHHQNVVFRAANLPDPYRQSMPPVPAIQAGMRQWWAPAVLLRTTTGDVLVAPVKNDPTGFPFQAVQQPLWAPVPSLHPTAGDFRGPNQPDPYRHSMAPIPAWQAGMQSWWAPVPALHPTITEFHGATENDARPSQLPLQAIQQSWWAPIVNFRATVTPFHGATENDARPSQLPIQAIQTGWWAPVPSLHPTAGDFRGATENDYRPSQFPFAAINGNQLWWAPAVLFRSTNTDVAPVLEHDARVSRLPYQAIQGGWWAPIQAMHQRSEYASGPAPAVGADAIVVWRHRAGWQ